MGFDISGLNPKMNVKEEDFKTLFKYNHNKYETFDEWHNALDEAGVRKEYQEQMEQFEDANPGIYFRNNVWWWRPLWAFICDNCHDILDEDDMERGSFNDGHKITKKKSIELAMKLEALDAEGAIVQWQAEYLQEQEDAPDEDCELCEATGKRKKAPEKGAGNIKCNGCNGKGKKRPWQCSYPFDRENVMRFARFARESGGFIIC
jgi:hypothetical protein